MKNIIKFIFTAILCSSMYSCGGIDETYKEFLENSDKLYPGKVDSVQTFTGKERIKFKFLLSSDPKVTHLRIFWNGKLDSIETPVTPGEIGEYKEVMIPSIKEDDHTFYIITYDRNNANSVPAEVFSKVYGSNFENKLSNRYIVSSNHYDGNDIDIQWDATNISYADVRVEVNYENTDGEQQTVIVSMDEMNTVLPDYQTGKPFSYQTYIRPDSSCMDEFTAEIKEQNVLSYYDVLKTSEWNIKAVSGEDPSQPANLIIDGNTSSYWSSEAGGNYPHWVIIDMNRPIPVNAFYFVQRTSSYTAQIREVEILTNATGDDTQPWVPLADSYTLNQRGDRQNAWLETTTNLRYVKFIFKSDWADSRNLSLIELGALQQW